MKELLQIPDRNCDSEVMVLLSGGIDSTATLEFYRQLGRPACSLFVDYGQPAAEQEKRAASAIAADYDVPLDTVTYVGPHRKTAGLIEGRNSFLFASAVMERPQSVSVIALGLHSSAGYPDCGPQFLESIQALMNLAGGHPIAVAAPFLTFSKHQIIEFCESNRVPLHLTYSCEEGGPTPCGACLSCQDRATLHVET